MWALTLFTTSCLSSQVDGPFDERHVEKAKGSSEEAVLRPEGFALEPDLNTAPGWTVWVLLEKQFGWFHLQLWSSSPLDNTVLMNFMLFKERTFGINRLWHPQVPEWLIPPRSCL